MKRAMTKSTVAESTHFLIITLTFDYHNSSNQVYNELRKALKEKAI